jgi:hypothetical protein
MADRELVRTLKAGLILLAAIQQRIADNANASFVGEEGARDLKRVEKLFDSVYESVTTKERES